MMMSILGCVVGVSSLHGERWGILVGNESAILSYVPNASPTREATRCSIYLYSIVQLRFTSWCIIQFVCAVVEDAAKLLLYDGGQ
jgi:hypothetical protein